MIEKLIRYLFYTLFFITPLIWSPQTSELFEFNKMMFVYGATIVILALWLIRMVLQKKLIIMRTPLDIPIILFLFANILSTIFSIDQHISIWGYYSRLNGGLLSTISYITLFYALVSNFDEKRVLNLLKSAVWGGAVVALYAIPEHFGASPSCFILHGEWNVDCWVQRVQERVFATLGQPNWLAAYLGMLIFPSLYFLLTAKGKVQILFYSAISIAFYMAFTFTYSRGAAIGLLASLVVFTALLFVSKDIFVERKKFVSFLHLLGIDFLTGFVFAYFQELKNGSLLSFVSKTALVTGILLFIQFFAFQFKYLKEALSTIPNKWWFYATITGFLIINLYFGSTLFIRFQSLFRFSQPSIIETRTHTSTGATQLETGGTESGQIRWIVWQGALDIFRAYPIFGSGVETFAHAYYTFRPKEHNNTTEWDFLYNKAHNEFLNYLSTTGIVGFTTYMTVILVFVVWTVKRIILETTVQKQIIFSPLPLLLVALLAGYLSYLIQNSVGFSVVITALFFYLFPAIAFVGAGATHKLGIPKGFPILASIKNGIYKRDAYWKAVLGIICGGAVILLFILHQLYQADILYNQGNKANSAGNPGKAYSYFADAVKLNPYEPLYKSEFAYSAAAASIALEQEDASLSAQLKDQAITITTDLLNRYPHNVSLHRTAIRTYYLLSTDDADFITDTLELLDKTIQLAPTDPKLLYNKAVILSQENKIDEAKKVLEETIFLKNDYSDAHYALGLLYFQEGEKQKAIEQMQKVLQIIPNHQEAIEKLKSWDSTTISNK